MSRLISLENPYRVGCAAGKFVVISENAVSVVEGGEVRDILGGGFDNLCPDGEHIWAVKPLLACQIEPQTGAVRNKRQLFDESMLFDPVRAVVSGDRMIATAGNHLLRFGGPSVVDKRDRFWGLALSADGKTVATGRSNGDIELRDSQDLKVRTRLTGLGAPILAIAFSPDGMQLAASDDHRQLRVFDLLSGQSRVTDPLGKVVEIIWRSDGFIAVGLSRLIAEFPHDGPPVLRSFEELGVRTFQSAALNGDTLALVVEKTGLLLVDLKA